MAIGGTYNGKSPANWGDIAAYSMHPLKSLNVMGDGGFITTNNHELADWLRKYRNHGMINRNEIEFYGVNSRLQPTQAIVASIELSFLDEYISKRKRLASLYDRGLSVLNPHIKIPPRNNQDVDTYSLYIIQCQNRDRLLSYLQSKGIEAKIHYPIPLHEQQAHKLFAGDEIELENTSKQAKHILTLPCHQYLNDDDIQFVIKAIKDFYEE
jgi:dTDP-4-amino-4,6-dideoxygalactose transaminase